jgi:hypothetical protein
MAHRRRRAGAGSEPDSPFVLWWLFWAAVILAVLGTFGIALTARPPAGAASGSELAWGLLASAMILIWAVTFRLVFWCIGRIASAPLRRGLYVILPVVVLLAREGALGARPAAWCGFELRTGSSEGSTWARSTITRPPAGGHGAFTLGCSVSAGAAGAGSHAARGFAAELASSCIARPGADVQLRYTLEASDAWCYLPLVKWATWPYTVHIELTGAVAASSVVEGRIEQRSYGLDSCRGFDERLGRAAAHAARAEAERLLRQLRDESASRRVSTPARTARRSAPGSR